MKTDGLINGQAPTVSAVGTSSYEMVQSAGFSWETILIGVLIWLICKLLDGAWEKWFKKK